MARLPDSYIDQVLARSDLESLIGQSVELKRQGRNLTGLCPFHTEKSPSFSVNPDKGVYYCFGCGASGNAVSFLMNREGLSFREAVLQLGERAGISPPQEDGPDPYEGLREVMARSHRLFVKNLEGEEGRAARQYLDERGIGPEVRKEYRLGFAPDAWDRLVLELGPRDAPKGEVAGVVVRNEAGRLYDRFRSRIIIPITDDRGRLVSFGGRIVGAGEPKYLNGPESPLFHKGELLYGLHEALPAIRKERRAIVVEGVRVGREAVLGAGVVLTASTTLIDVRGSEPVESKGRVPERAVVIPGTRPKRFPAGEYQIPCALIIGERKPSTDRKVSLEAALREFAVAV